MYRTNENGTKTAVHRFPTIADGTKTGALRRLRLRLNSERSGLRRAFAMRALFPTVAAWTTIRLTPGGNVSIDERRNDGGAPDHFAIRTNGAES